MKLRSLYHLPKGEKGIGKWIVGWTWILAAVYSLPKLFRKPPEGSSRWKEYKQALKYNFSHEELWMPDEDGDFRVWKPYTPGKPSFRKPIEYAGQCFSSTTRGNAEGVRFAPASEVLKHPERWKYIEFEVNEGSFEDILIFMEMHAKWKTKYDFAGIMGFVIPFTPQDDDKWYCSEICNYVKADLNVISEYSEPVSPRRSAMLLAKDWGEPRPV